MTDWLDLFKRGALTVNVNLCVSGTEGVALGQVLKAIEALGAKVDNVADEAARLKTEVQEIRTAISDAVARFQEIAQELKDAIANNNQAAMKEAADALDEAAGELQRGTSPVVDPPPPEDAPPQARRK